MDVVAPGIHIPTTSINSSYYLDFDGTSSACPHVAGVAALILSINPNLTQDEVRDIIESTAQKVGDYTYQTTPGRPNGLWNEEMGYGLLDAYEAVKMAMTCSNFVLNQTISQNSSYNGCYVSVKNVEITGGASVIFDSTIETVLSSDFKVNLGCYVEIK